MMGRLLARWVGLGLDAMLTAFWFWVLGVPLTPLNLFVGGLALVVLCLLFVSIIDLFELTGKGLV